MQIEYPNDNDDSINEKWFAICKLIDNNVMKCKSLLEWKKNQKINNLIRELYTIDLYFDQYPVNMILQDIHSFVSSHLNEKKSSLKLLGIFGVNDIHRASGLFFEMAQLERSNVAWLVKYHGLNEEFLQQKESTFTILHFLVDRKNFAHTKIILNEYSLSGLLTKSIDEIKQLVPSSLKAFSL